MIAGLFRQHLIPVCLGMILLSGMLLMGKECPAETDPCVVKDREEIYDTIERPKDDMDDFYPGWREKADWIRPYFFDFQEPSHMPTQFGVFRLDPRAPKIDGLYFAGETVNSTGATMSGASDTAMICTREILGTDEL